MLMVSLVILIRYTSVQWRRKQFASGGAQCRREAPAEHFWDVPPHFSLVPPLPPPHEGAQRLFITD